MSTKSFHIGDILSVIHDCLVSPDYIDGVYNILNWMTQDTLFTHQLSRASRECQPFLKALFPDLAEITIPQFNSKAEVWTWLDEMVEEYGSHRDVPLLDQKEHTRINPIYELENTIGTDRVISIVM